MNPEKVIKILKMIRGLFVIVCVLSAIYCIWNFNWPTFKLILTLSFINFLITTFLNGLDDNDEDDEPPKTSNRFQDKLDQKMKEATS